MKLRRTERETFAHNFCRDREIRPSQRRPRAQKDAMRESTLRRIRLCSRITYYLLVLLVLVLTAMLVVGGVGMEDSIFFTDQKTVIRSPFPFGPRRKILTSHHDVCDQGDVGPEQAPPAPQPRTALQGHEYLLLHDPAGPRRLIHDIQFSWGPRMIGLEAGLQAGGIPQP